MADRTLPGGSPVRRGLFALVGIAVVSLAILVAWRVGTLIPGGPVAAASGRPLPQSTGLASPIAPEPTTTVPPTAPPPTPIPTPRMVAAPLTGLPVTPAAALQHPMAVMVDDHPAGRPQSGFNAASVVWHAPAEGGTPRYMLVFQDKVPSDVGPVRSAREYYVEWAAEWKAMYVHSGGSPQALQTLIARGQGQWVYNADEYRWGGRYLWRAAGHVAPHNVYSDGAHLRDLADRLSALDEPIEPVWSFAPDAARGLRPDGGSITVVYRYATVTYRYDASSNRYVRYLDRSKTPQVDVADGQVVAPANVVILRMRFGPLNDGNPAAGRLEARNVGTGEAWIARNGRTVKGSWSKASVTAPTLLFGPDGRAITFTAGQTFVQVIPLTYRFQVVDGTRPPHPVPPQ